MIDSCKTDANETLAKACMQFPNSHACKNYKNIFCQKCNDVNNELGDCFDFQKEYEKEKYTDNWNSYEKSDLEGLIFFTLEDFEDSYVKNHQNNTKCSFDQIYDFAVSYYFDIILFKKDFLYNQ